MLNLKFSTMKSNLKLISWRPISPIVHKVLIVGNHIQMYFQMKISNELYRKFGANIRYLLQSIILVKLIKLPITLFGKFAKNNIIPVADIVISYGFIYRS